MESRFREKSIIFPVFFDFLPREVWLGGTHVCLGETHVCLGQTHVCLGETHVCLGETLLCLGETHSGLISLFFPPCFFSNPFFLGSCLCFFKIPFFPPIEFFYPLRAPQTSDFFSLPEHHGNIFLKIAQLFFH